MGKLLGTTGLTHLWSKIEAALGLKENKATIVNHGTSDTTFALTPNILHVWGTINSLTLSLVTDSDNYVDGYWFKFTAGSSFTALTMPSGVAWVTEPEIEAGKTYEVMIVDGLASYVTDSIGDSVKAKTRIVNHGTSDTTYQLAPNEFHIWGEVASLTLTLKDESSNYVDGYWFRFTCGSTPTVLTLPSSVEWYYEDVVFEANHTYEVTIVEGKACYTDYASTTSVATKQWVQSNIKTINGNSLIGTGDITIEGGGGDAAAKVPVINHGTSDTTYTLPPNEFHIWGEVASLTLTLGTGESGYVNGYWFRFTSGNTPTVLTLPNTIQWYDEEAEIEEGKTYEVTIVEGYACITHYILPDSTVTKEWVQNNAQATLVSGTNIKTINNESILGSGNITIQGGSGGGGDENVIEVVKVNGTALTPDSNKAVDITVPAAVTESTVSGWGFTKNSGTYSKPSGGIPKTDLASAVQTSLGLADTALQSFTETDPTVPAWAKATNKPTYTASEVGALPDTTVIPSAPGTLNTTATTAQTTSSSEALSGSITLHKVAKTGTYNDLIGKPTIPAAVTESTVSGWGFTKNTGTYSKPSGGIPASDLAAGVIPTVPTNVSSFTNDAGYITSANVATIYSGSTTPSSSLGNNGDIYIQTS